MTDNGDEVFKAVRTLRQKLLATGVRTVGQEAVDVECLCAFLVTEFEIVRNLGLDARVEARLRFEVVEKRAERVA